MVATWHSEIGESLDELLESTLANRFVTHWRITILLVAESQRFLQEINTLAGGSPTRFPRILSYGLANLRSRRRTSFPCERILYPPTQRVDEHVLTTKGARAADLGPLQDWQLSASRNRLRMIGEMKVSQRYRADPRLKRDDIRVGFPPPDDAHPVGRDGARSLPGGHGGGGAPIWAILAVAAAWPTRGHIHAVVRTPNGNDGKDLLHYEAHAHDPGHGHRQPFGIRVARHGTQRLNET